MHILTSVYLAWYKISMTPVQEISFVAGSLVPVKATIFRLYFFLCCLSWFFAELFQLSVLKELNVPLRSDCDKIFSLSQFHPVFLATAVALSSPYSLTYSTQSIAWGPLVAPFVANIVTTRSSADRSASRKIKSCRILSLNKGCEKLTYARG